MAGESLEMATETVTPAELLARMNALVEKAGKIENIEQRQSALEAANSARDVALQAIQAKMREWSISLPGTEDLRKKGDYKYANVYRALLEGRNEADYERIAPKEWDVSKQCRARVSEDMLSRLMSTTNPSSGGFLVSEEIASGIQPKLDAQAITKLLGITVVRPSGYPYRKIKQTGGATASMAAEGGTVSASDLAWGRINLQPKKCQARSFVTLEEVMFASPSIETEIENDLALRIALKQDQQVIGGSGTDNEVMGIVNTSGLNSVNTGATTKLFWGDLSKGQQELDEDNVIYTTLGLGLHPRVKHAMFRQLKSGASSQTEAQGAGFIAETPFLSDETFKKITGFDIKSSTQFPTTLGASSNETWAILGKWADFYLAEFGGMILSRSDVATDGTLNAWTQDGVHVKANSWFDGAVIQPESFTLLKSLVFANVV